MKKKVTKKKASKKKVIVRKTAKQKNFENFEELAEGVIARLQYWIHKKECPKLVLIAISNSAEDTDSFQAARQGEPEVLTHVIFSMLKNLIMDFDQRVRPEAIKGILDALKKELARCL